MENPSFILFFFFFLFPLLTAAPASVGDFSMGRERRSHIQFYIHDKVSRPNATSIKVASDPNSSLPSSAGLHFASIYVMDDPLTEGPNLASKLLGRAKGFYVVSSLDGSDLILNMHVIFTEGVYNGSSVAITARDSILEKVRELTVVGGTGIFRLARGFAFMTTHTSDFTTGDTVLHVDAYVLHHEAV